jgi:uncharacterized repeat protein (TIGR01451 family)
MKRILSFVLVAILSLPLGIGVTSVNAVDSGNLLPDGLITIEGEDKPYENPGAILVDVTDLLPNDHTAGFVDFAEKHRVEIRRRTNDIIYSSGFRFVDSVQNVKLPVVTLIANGQPLGYTKEDDTVEPFSINQAVAAPGGVVWDFTCDTSGALGPNDPRWDCTSEMPNIEFFVKGGGNGITVGIEQCIQDVFGASFNSQEVSFVRDNGMGIGVAAFYTTSIPDGSGGWIAEIHMPTGYGADHDTRPDWIDGTTGLVVGQWQTSARNGRLDTLTHEMIHAHYDQLNPKYHPWGEGMVEMQAILARRLFCQRNSYDPGSILNYGAEWSTAMEKQLARRPNLNWGVPVTLPNYENLNQSGIQASGGFFNTFPVNQRAVELGWARYNIASSCWWKVWRETSPAIIDNANPLTWGPDTYFNDWNTRYFDYWFANGSGWGVLPAGIYDNVALFNQLTTETLFNDVDMGGETNVEEEDYETIWYGNQQILGTGTNTGEHLFVPSGPSQPTGGRPYLAADLGNEEFICDFGAYYSDDVGGSYVPAYPFLYNTISGGPMSGAEVGIPGELHIEIWEIDDNDDETTDVTYHNGPAWQNLPAYGTNIPGLAFDGLGHLPNHGGQAQGLNFINVGGDEGGFRITYSVDTDGVLPIEYEAEVVTYFACDEHQGPGNHTTVVVGDGNSNADRLYLTYDGGAEVGPFNGGDSAYNDDWPGGVFSSHRIAYRFDGVGLEFDSYTYANTGPFFYAHVHAPAVQRLVQDLPAYTGHIGHAILVQSTRYNNPNDTAAAAARHYYCQFVSDNTIPATDSLPNKTARPDYIPADSNIIAAYLYTNECGRVVSGNWQQEPVLVNPGKSTNQVPWEYCDGEYIGSNLGGVPASPARCDSGGGSEVNIFRFDITKYLVDLYDNIHVTNVYQQTSSGGGNLYGFTILVIFENEDLPLSRIMIADGAYDAGRPVGNHVVSNFAGFRTPPNVSEWESDNSGGKAYITHVGLSTDNSPCGSDSGSGAAYRGRWEPEWDFFAIGSDRLPEGDRLWPSPLPAPEGAWWAFTDPGRIGDRAHHNGVPSYSPATLPPGFPADYRFSPRATAPEWYSAGKQMASQWFWNRHFSNGANKTAIAWDEDTYWDDVVHRDYADLGDGNGFGWNLEQRDVDDPAYNGLINPFYSPTTHIQNSYLAGNDTSIWYRPYAVCSDAEYNTATTDDEFDFTDGIGPCVPTEIGNMNSGQQPNCSWDYYHDRRTRMCGTITGAPYPSMPHPQPKYPTTEEEGAAHTMHLLQVPIIPSLSLTKTAYPSDTVLPDSVITYSLVITNDTPFTQQGVMLTENYPMGVMFLDANPPPDIGDNVWTTSISDDGNLDPHESFTVIVRVTVDHLKKGTRLMNVATTSAETAPTPVSAQYLNTCLGEPKLTISKTSKKFLAIQGDKIKFRIIVKNVGDREAENVVLTDMFPREFEYIGSVPAGSQGLNKVTWAIGTLNTGQTWYVDLILKLRDDIRINPGISVINRAVVISSEGLRAEDESVIIVYRRPDQPITCPKVDIDVSYDGKELCISVDKFGGCSPYTLRITSPENDIDILATIDEVSMKKCLDLDISSEGTLQIEIKNRYAGSYYYCYKITPDGIEAAEIPCP